MIQSVLKMLQELSPQKIYETIQMARNFVGNDTHIRLHTHETAGVSVACYLAALKLVLMVLI